MALVGDWLQQLIASAENCPTGGDLLIIIGPQDHAARIRSQRLNRQGRTDRDAGIRGLTEQAAGKLYRVRGRRIRAQDRAGALEAKALLELGSAQILA